MRALNLDFRSDDELNRWLKDGAAGHKESAQCALLAIAMRVAAGQKLTAEAAKALLEGLARVVDSDGATRFLGAPSKRGRPRQSRTPFGGLVEALILAGVRAEGYPDLSVDRAGDSGVRSSYQEAAIRLGVAKDAIDREAERLKKQASRAKEAFRKKCPDGDKF